MNPIQLVDLTTQHLKIKSEIDAAINEVIRSGSFIKGKQVSLFEQELAQYLQVKHVIGCGNGTDALMLALMALDLKPGNEVIVPTFTFVATAEVVAFLNLVPVFVDVNPQYFTIDVSQIEKSITPRTRAIIPVHLFGQCAPMAEILEIANKYHLYVIEDAAQSLGAEYKINDKKTKAGTIGHIGCTSFFPSKNLGCMGDGGAIFTNNDEFAQKIRMLANHGAEKKYFHQYIGINSRLDTLQAAVLRVKLQYLNNYIQKRNWAAQQYIEQLKDIVDIVLPKQAFYSSHTYNQFTIQLQNEKKRNVLQQYLQQKNIPTAIYYPLPLHLQPAFQNGLTQKLSLPIAEILSNQVISLPMHTELDEEQIQYITASMIDFFKNNF